MNDRNSTASGCLTRPWNILGLSVALLVLAVGINWANSSAQYPSVLLGTPREHAGSMDASASEGRGLLTKLFEDCLSFVRKTRPSPTAGPDAGDISRLSKQTSEDTPNMAPNTQPSDETYPGSRKRAHSIGAGSMRKAMEDSDLWHAISDERFWRMPEDEVLILIRDEFSNELDRLKNAYSLKATGVPRPRSPSISERLYHGKNYDEINRTLLGVLVLRWIVTNDYDSFTRNQKPELALKRDSFDWLHTFFWSKLNTPDDAYALVLSMIINDLGKDPNLAADYAELKGEDITNVNHDMILLCAVEAGMVKALDRLTDQHREFLMDGIRLGSELNFGQLAQAENAPASLAGLEDMRGKDRAFQMRFMEQVLDVSGAKGHEDWTAALVMIEPVFQSYHNVYDVASGIISGSYTLRQGFDLILTRKLELLQKAGFDHSFDINKPTDRAMLRIFCLGNTNSPENAEIFYRAFFDSIPDIEREDLVHGLNLDGSEAEPAIQPTYTPAMLAKAMANTKKGTPEEKVRAIAAMLRYLVRVFKRARTITQGVTVVEREVRLVDAVVSSAEFKERPEIVTQQPVPEDQVANRVRV